MKNFPHKNCAKRELGPLNTSKAYSCYTVAETPQAGDDTVSKNTSNVIHEERKVMR